MINQRAIWDTILLWLNPFLHMLSKQHLIKEISLPVCLISVLTPHCVWLRLIWIQPLYSYKVWILQQNKTEIQQDASAWGHQTLTSSSSSSSFGVFMLFVLHCVIKKVSLCIQQVSPSSWRKGWERQEGCCSVKPCILSTYSGLWALSWSQTKTGTLPMNPARNCSF